MPFFKYRQSVVATLLDHLAVEHRFYAIIGASQALDPGSSPGERRRRRGIGAIGSARALQARGTGIETPMLHFGTMVFFFPLIYLLTWLYMRVKPSGSELGWPSGLRRLTQVQFSSEAWVRIPLQARFPFDNSYSSRLRTIENFPPQTRTDLLRVS